MKISEILNNGKPTLSFEVFPPKTADKFDSVEKAVTKIAALSPAFMSVTYGAGGGTSLYTSNIAASIQDLFKVPTLAHLTCLNSDRSTVTEKLDGFKARGIENIMALRGDIPEGFDMERPRDFQHASDLVAFIREYGDFCIGGACYPEGHVESTNKKEDILNLKKKVDAGVDFLTTQMFFDNSIMYNFLYRVRDAGMQVPVIAGIMPITNRKQVDRVMALSGTSFLPARFKALVDRFGDDPKAMRQAGIAYATDQIIDLIANGVDHIHVYTMNMPSVAAGIAANISEILK